MKTKIVLLLILIVTTASGQRVRTVSDPNGILDVSDSFVGSIDFENAIKCGQSIEKLDIQCNMQSHPDSCGWRTSSVDVVSCRADEMVVVSSSVDEDEVQIITKSDYNKLKGNMLRALTQENNVIKKLLFEDDSLDVYFVSYKFDRRLYLGQMMNFMDVSILFRSCNTNSKCVEIPTKVSLTNDLPFLAQVAELKLGIDSWQLTSKVTKFTKK